MKKTINTINNETYTYNSTGLKTIYISNTLSSIQFIGNDKGSESNGLTVQLNKIINTGTNLQLFKDDCCIGCKNLTDVNANVIAYGKNSFKDCTSLSNVQQLTDGTPINGIDDAAFMNTGLTNINLYLQNASPDYAEYNGCVETELLTGPYVGISAFANNKSLKTVTFKKSNQLNDYMFANCDKLENVMFEQTYGSCVGKYVFKDCTSLKSIEFPKDFDMFDDYMFDGCTELTAVNLQKSDNKDVFIFGKNIFNNCPKLTSITIPGHIDSFKYFNSNTFAGSNITEIRFMNSDIETILNNFTTKINPTEKGISFEQLTDTTTTDNYKYGKLYFNNIEPIVKFSEANDIPLIYIVCGPGCGWCKRLISDTLENKTFQDWMKSQPYLFGYGYPFRNEYEFFRGYKIIGKDKNGENKVKKLDTVGFVKTLEYVCYTEKGKIVQYESQDGDYVYGSAIYYWPSKNVRYIGGMRYIPNKKEIASGKGTQYDPRFKALADNLFKGYTRDPKFNYIESTNNETLIDVFNCWGNPNSCDIIVVSGSTEKKYRWNVVDKTLTLAK